jgi:hypothetical protein
MAFQDWTTAGDYTFTVPHGVKQITFRMRGAGAGSGNAGGGGGAYVRHTLSVSPGDVLSFHVGAAGIDYATSSGSNHGGDTIWNSGQFVAGGGQDGFSGGTPNWSGGAPDYSENGGDGGVEATCCDCLSWDCSDCINQTCEVDCGTQDCSDCTEGQTCGVDCGTWDCSDCINQSCGSDCGTCTDNECGTYVGGGGSSGGETSQNNGQNGSCSAYNSGSDGSGGAAPTEGGTGGDGGSNSGMQNGGGAGGGFHNGSDGYVKIEWTPGHLAFDTVPNGTRNVALATFHVTAYFADSTVDTSYAGSVTLSFTVDADPTTTISGTNPETASSGVATYPNINLNHIGTGFEFHAVDGYGDLDPADSNTFDISDPVDLPLVPLEVETFLVSPAIVTTNLYYTPPVRVPNPRVGPPALRRQWQQRPQLLQTSGPPTTDLLITPLEVETFLVSSQIVTANNYDTPQVRIPNPRVGPPALRRTWKQQPQLEFAKNAPTSLDMAAMEVEVSIVNSPLITTNTYWFPPTNLPNPKVGPPALRRTWRQQPALNPSFPAVNLALTPMQVVVQEVNSQPTNTPAASPPGANAMKYWFNGLPLRGTNNANKPLNYWFNGRTAQPLISGDAINLNLVPMRVQVNQVVPPQSAGAALTISSMRVEAVDIPLAQVGGVNVVTFAMPVIVTVSEQPQSDATIALPAMQTEVRSNIQATTGGSGLQLPSLQVPAVSGVNLATGSPSLTVGLAAEVNLLNQTPSAGSQVPMFPLEIEVEYAASVTGGAGVPAFSMEVISAVGVESVLITPEIILTLQAIDVEDLPINLEYDTNISLSLQEMEVPNLYKIDRLLGGQASSHFMEIERSAVSVMIFGSEPNQPFKFNPSATTFHRNGPSHTIHLSRVKPDFTTINATFELLTPFAELQPNEFLYEAPGGFLRIWNEDVIQASLIQDGDDPAIVISVTPVNQVFNPVAATSLAAARVTT